MATIYGCVCVVAGFVAYIGERDSLLRESQHTFGAMTVIGCYSATVTLIASVSLEEKQHHQCPINNLLSLYELFKNYY